MALRSRPGATSIEVVLPRRTHRA
ncbi:hypothetical protein [Nocardioides zeae]